MSGSSESPSPRERGRPSGSGARLAGVESARWAKWGPRAVELRDTGLTWERTTADLNQESGEAFTVTAERLFVTRAKQDAGVKSDAPETVVRPMIQRPRLSQVLDLNPQPFAVPVPRVARSNHENQTKCWTALVLTDTHVPYQDEAALSVIYGLIRDIQPRVIVHLGDLLDCYRISRYTKDRTHILNTQDEIDGARRILHHISTLAPAARKVLLEGNHEARLDELLNTLPGTASELTQLRSIQRAMTWPALLQLEDIGWEFVPVKGQAHVSILPKLITKHGNVVRKWSGQSGKGEWEKYGMSGLSGHVHRVGQFYTQDRNGNHCWTECGCTCLLKPEYCEDPNWAHACVLVHFTPDGSRFSVEPVYIQDGRALWRTTEYRAA